MNLFSTQEKIMLIVVYQIANVSDAGQREYVLLQRDIKNRIDIKTRRTCRFLRKPLLVQFMARDFYFFFLSFHNYDVNTSIDPKC